MATPSSVLLENRTDRGAWWATVQRVVKSQTQLSVPGGTTLVRNKAGGGFQTLLTLLQSVTVGQA